MLTLSYGFLKPENGDRGSVFFPALAGDIQQLNDHSHDGNNSAKLTAGAVAALTGNVPSASWVANGSGYRQAVTLPGSMAYDTTTINMQGATNGHVYFLQVEKINATSYYVYCNDNTLSFTAVYTS